jgi:hypothetical protein
MRHPIAPALGLPAGALGTPIAADPRTVHIPGGSGVRSTPAPTAPPAPAPGSSGAATGGAAGGIGFGGMAAILVTLMLCWAASAMRPHRLVPALWRPMAFVSIQERPG